MPITPAYFLGLELKYLAATVNASECWRALVAQPDYTLENLFALADAATSDEATALAAIFRGDIAAASVAYPLCQVDHMIDGDFERVDTGSWSGQRQFIVTFEHTIPTSYDLAEGQEYWREVVGRIMREISVAIRDTPAGLSDLERMSLQYGYGNQDDQNDGRYHGIARIIFYAHGEVY